MALIEFDNCKQELLTYKEPLEELGQSLDLENKNRRIAEMERQMEEPSFWDDAEKSAKFMKDLNSLKSSVQKYDSLNSQFDDIEAIIEMGAEEDNEELAAEAREMLGLAPLDREAVVKALEEVSVEDLEAAKVKAGEEFGTTYFAAKSMG